MKKVFLICVCCFCLFIISCPNPASSPTPTPVPVPPSALTFTTAEFRDVNLSPPYIKPVKSFSILFNHSLKAETVMGSVTLESVETGGVLKRVDTDVTLNSEQKIVTVTLKDDMEEGKEYRLTILSDITAKNETRLFRTFKGATFTWHPIPPTPPRSAIVVISDTHIQDKRSWTPDAEHNGHKYGVAVNDDPNRAELLRFLLHIQSLEYVKELVLAGDIFDTWFTPMDKVTFIDKEGLLTLDHSKYMREVIKRDNASIITALKNIANAGIKVVYVPGNHDMHVTKADFEDFFGTDTSKFEFQGKMNGIYPLGMGAYTIDGGNNPNIVIEHGHRYDFFNAPDHFSNKSSSGDYQREKVDANSMLPPGFFVTKIAVSNDRAKAKANLNQGAGQANFGYDGLSTLNFGFGVEPINYEKYAIAWKTILSSMNVDWESKLKTGFDGYEMEYDLYGFVPPFPIYYRDYIYSSIHTDKFWNLRRVKNGVDYDLGQVAAIMLGVSEVLMDYQAVPQYFRNAKYTEVNRPQIVVFGHTHMPSLNSYSTSEGKEAVQVNAGSWVDKKWTKYETRTYALLYPRTDSSTSVEVVLFSTNANPTVQNEVLYSALVRKK